MTHRSRHSTLVRVTHWLTAASFGALLVSGIAILLAHPRLYWGRYGANPDYSWLQIGNLGEQGFLRVGDHMILTTGFLGAWMDRLRTKRNVRDFNGVGYVIAARN